MPLFTLDVNFNVHSYHTDGGLVDHSMASLEVAWSERAFGPLEVWFDPYLLVLEQV